MRIRLNPARCSLAVWLGSVFIRAAQRRNRAEAAQVAIEDPRHHRRTPTLRDNALDAR